MTTVIHEAVIEFVYNHVDEATESSYAKVSASLDRLEAETRFDLEAAVNAYAAKVIEAAFHLGIDAGRNPHKLILPFILEN